MKKCKIYKIESLKAELRESYFGWGDIGKRERGNNGKWKFGGNINLSVAARWKEQHSRAAGNEP